MQASVTSREKKIVMLCRTDLIHTLALMDGPVMGISVNVVDTMATVIFRSAFALH
jgi:hypothetical protein